MGGAGEGHQPEEAERALQPPRHGDGEGDAAEGSTHYEAVRFVFENGLMAPVADDAWSVKESVVSEEDFPEWGPRENRGVQMEVSTAAACLAGGSNAVILRHPESVKTISELIADLT